MPQTRYIACHIRKIVLVIATLCEGLRAPPPVKMLTISSLILLHFGGRFLPVCWQVLMGKRWGFRREEVYLEGTMLISRERNVFRGNEIYFEGTKYIWKDRNIFRGNEIYLEGLKYISMERNNISEFPHVPLGAPYVSYCRLLYLIVTVII